MNADADRSFDETGHAGLVLVVEDEYFIAMDLRDTLTGAGYQVLGPARTATDALELLNNHSPAAAVLDVNLGGQRVTPVAQALTTRSIPYVLASAYTDLDLDNEPLLAKAVNLGKPTLPVALLAAVRRMISAAPRADER